MNYKKTGQLKAPATGTQFLRLRKVEPLRHQVWHVGFSEWWKVEVVLGISQQAGFAGRTSAPLRSHLSFYCMWSPSGAVPMVCANQSMLCRVWSKRHNNHNTPGEAADADMPPLPDNKSVHSSTQTLPEMRRWFLKQNTFLKLACSNKGC